MSTRVGDADTPFIDSRDELVAELEAGVKPDSDWRIGTEHEKFCFYEKDDSPVPYEGERGIAALLTGLQRRCGEPVLEQGNIIALQRQDCSKGGVISLEPGGQLELSGPPLENLHQTYEETHQHLIEVKQVGGEHGNELLSHGYTPK